MSQQPGEITSNNYGKTRVRLMRVHRDPSDYTNKHVVSEYDVQVLLEGPDLKEGYITGSNKMIVATDSIKNTVYVLAKRCKQVYPLENFAIVICKHFLDTYTHVSNVIVDISEVNWKRMDVDGKPHPFSFEKGSEEKYTVNALASRNGINVTSGTVGMTVLKSTGSEFADFYTDMYRTLPDAFDRIFATVVSSKWTYNVRYDQVDYKRVRDDVGAAFKRVFAGLYSKSVQQSLHYMLQEALKSCPEIQTISLSLPNKHYIPFNLTPFNLKNENEVFVPVDEPSGLISATVTRKEKSKL